MKIPVIAILIIFSTFVFSGCATQRTVNVQLDEPWHARFTPNSYGSLPANSPENCQNALLEGFWQNSDCGRINSIRYANTMIANWPHHQYLSSSVHLAGWSVLLVDTNHRASAAGSDSDSWDKYIDSLLTSSHYFEMSAREDSSPDGFWTFASGAPLSIIHEGFENVEALRLYLAIQRLSKGISKDS